MGLLISIHLLVQHLLDCFANHKDTEQVLFIAASKACSRTAASTQ